MTLLLSCTTRARGTLQVALGSPIFGRQAMLDGLISFFHAFPDNFTRIENLFEYR